MIPKIIHYCWLSKEPYPELVRNCIYSWKQKLKDYKFILWDTKKFKINSCLWVNQAYKSKKYALAADYIRFFALYKYGGIYLDADVEVFKNFNDLLNQKSFMGHEMSGDFEPAIIGSESKAKWINKCLAYYKNRAFITADGKLDTQPLPVVVRKVFGQDYDNESLLFSKYGLRLYDYSYFSPKNPYNNTIKISKHTYTVHHFQGTGVKKNVSFYIKAKLHSIIIFIFGIYLHKYFVHKIRALVPSRKEN